VVVGSRWESIRRCKPAFEAATATVEAMIDQAGALCIGNDT
jgi:hypothetical protein